MPGLFYRLHVYGKGDYIRPSPNAFVSPLGTEIFFNVAKQGERDGVPAESFHAFVVGYQDRDVSFNPPHYGFIMVLEAEEQEDKGNGGVAYPFPDTLHRYLKSEGWKLETS